MSDGRPDRIDERARSDHSDRDRRERIRRLLERLEKAKPSNPALAGVIAGILDLLADEL